MQTQTTRSTWRVVRIDEATDAVREVVASGLTREQAEAICRSPKNRQYNVSVAAPVVEGTYVVPQIEVQS